MKLHLEMCHAVVLECDAFGPDMNIVANLKTPPLQYYITSHDRSKLEERKASRYWAADINTLTERLSDTLTARKSDG
jgi:hypothetical protein